MIVRVSVVLKRTVGESDSFSLFTTSDDTARVSNDKTRVGTGVKLQFLS